MTINKASAYNKVYANFLGHPAVKCAALLKRRK